MKWALAAALAATTMIAAPAVATPIYLDFENIAPYPNSSDVLINDFYNGGTSSIGTSGTNYGVQFTSEALLLCLNTAGTDCSNTSRGGQGISSSAFGALFFPSANPTMNVAAGFDTGFSFVYSDPFAVGTTVNVYDGLNGMGSLLTSATLPGTPQAGCDATIADGANYCPFNSYSVAFSGIAKSVVFGGPTNRQVFDDFTFGSVTVGGGGEDVSAAPEPAAWGMMLAGFGAIGATLRRRRRKSVSFA